MSTLLVQVVLTMLVLDILEQVLISVQHSPQLFAHLVPHLFRSLDLLPVKHSREQRLLLARKKRCQYREELLSVWILVWPDIQQLS